MDMYQAAVLAALVFTVPGFLLGWVSGLKAPWAAAASLPVSFGVYGLAAWLLGQMGLRYDLASATVMWALLMVIALIWRGSFLVVGRKRARRWAARRPVGAPAAGEGTGRETANQVEAGALSASDPPLTGSTAAHDPDAATVVTLPAEDVTGAPSVGAPGASGAVAAGERRESFWRRWWTGDGRRGSLLDPVWLLPAAGVLTGMYLFISKGLGFFEEVPRGIENIFQGWDVHWHASVVRWIMDAGVADPTRMGELQNIETQAQMYYPTAWHAGTYLLVEILGVSPIAAINLSSIVLPGLALPLSVALIAWRMVGNRGLTAQIAAGIGAIAVFASPVLFWVGHYVGAWPYLAAVAVSGIVLALFMLVPYRPVAALAAALSLAGMIQLHPAAATIAVLAVALWWLFRLLWAPARKARTWGGRIGYRLRDLGLLAAAGLAGVVILLPQILSGAESTEEVASFSAEEDVTRAESWEKAFTMYTRHVDAFTEYDPTLLLWVAGIGAVALLVWRRNLWAPAFYLLSVWMTANSLKAFEQPWGDWLNIVGSLHYSTAHRLVMPVALFTFAAAGVGVAVLIRLISLAPVKKWATGSAVVSVVLALLAGWGTAAWATRDAVEEGAHWSITAPRLDGRMVSEVDLRAFDWLARQPHAYDGMIMGEPADGHGWMYAYNGLPSVMRHYLWPTSGRGSATDLLYWHADLLGVGNHGDPTQENNVDRAAEELGVNFYFLSPWSFWAFQEPNWAMLDGLWHAPGATAVYQDQNVTIFAVNDAFTDEELAQMRAPGNSPQPLPPVPTRGELGIAESPAEVDEPYFHRPTTPDQGGPNPIPTPGNPNLEQDPLEIPATRP
ncbi:DUF6541 family protein [Corynebacterium halotolerans]|uniref:Rhamnopyranosyltransferase n=1 Tax=Corynebacterium halotolerans YIM 70093 = DSM 44683 TaxID=1121362 RepID=M1P4J9_9CORY|nr:DUF6541 family protein [Corynebacterium halotolerans]AGF71561.1 hypothetical protein A605_02735 [Corynebacterium halotolerans YIM 70093 = DSM 44683]